MIIHEFSYTIRGLDLFFYVVMFWLIEFNSVDVKLSIFHANVVGNDVCGHGKGLGSMSIQMQIVSALRLGDRNKASHLLSNLSNGNNSLRAADFVRILDYCAITPDPLVISSKASKSICLCVCSCICARHILYIG